MPRGRKAAAPEVKELRGDRASRINVLAPVSPAMEAEAIPPEILTTSLQKSKWQELCHLLTENGTLRVTDTDILAQYCVTFEIFSQAKKEVDALDSLTITTPKGFEQAAPQVTILRQSSELLCKIAAELGLTPSSRNRISGIAKDDKLAAELKFLKGHGKAKKVG